MSDRIWTENERINTGAIGRGFVGNSSYKEINRKEVDAVVDNLDLNPADVRWGSQQLLEYVVDEKIENQRPLSANTIKALLSRSVESEALVQDEGSEGGSEVEVIWPAGTEIEKADDKFLSFKSVALNNETVSLQTLAFRAALQLGPSEQVEVVNWALDLVQEVKDVDKFEFYKSLLNFIGRSKDSEASMAKVFNYIYDHSDKYEYKLSEHIVARDESGINALVDVVAYNTVSSNDTYESLGFMGGTRESMPKYLCEQTNIDKVKKLLGIFVDNTSFIEVINGLRGYIADTGDKRGEGVGRILIGFDADDDTRPFHTQLQNVYRAVRFEEYKPNLEATEYDTDFLMGQIKQHFPNNWQEIKVVDMGCGTGRLLKPLSENGLKMVGVDNSPENLAKAREHTSGLNVEYILGDIESNVVPEESVDCVILAGRTIPHSEDVWHFENWLYEISHMLKPGGIIIFDSPDPNKGKYLENRKNFIKILQNLGIPISMGEGLNNFYYLIDSPDGVNFYNRLVLPENYITQKIHSFFDIKPVDKYQIYKDSEDQGVYFVGKYKKS